MDPLHELDNRPAHHLLLVPLYVVTGLVAAVVPALIFLKVDRVVSGRGVLVPPESSIKVAALRTGIVRQVLVRDGESVEAGDPLVRLDTREDTSAVESLTAQVEAARTELERRERLIAGRRELAKLRGDLIASEKQSEQAGIESLRADAERLVREHEHWEKQLARQAALAEKKIATPSDVESARLERDNRRTRQQQTATSISQKEMLIDQLVQKGEGLAVEAAVENLREDLAVLECRRNLAALQRQLVDAELRLGRGTIVAPASGTVHALAVRTGGEYVAESDVVCRLVPPDTGLIAEIELAACDVGFVHAGQTTRIKLDAFPFEDYGACQGRVQFVAADADPADATGRKRLPSYTVRIHLEAESFAARQQEPVTFRPGMTLAAELVDRRESLAALLFRPLRKAGRQVSL